MSAVGSFGYHYRNVFDSHLCKNLNEIVSGVCSRRGLVKLCQSNEVELGLGLFCFRLLGLSLFGSRLFLILGLFGVLLGILFFFCGLFLVGALIERSDFGGMSAE